MEGENNGRRGFQKGNTLWKKGQESKKEMHERKIDVLFGAVANGLAEKYEELLTKQSKGVMISKTEEKFMDRYEKTFEYLKPKLARTEQQIEVKQSPFGLAHKELTAGAKYVELEED